MAGVLCWLDSPSRPQSEMILLMSPVWVSSRKPSLLRCISTPRKAPTSPSDVRLKSFWREAKTESRIVSDLANKRQSST
jgi:hypothetical protein